MDAERQIGQYLDGRMVPAQRERFEARLLAEPALADELARTRRALALLRATPLPTPPDLCSQIMAQVRQEKAPLRRPAPVEFVLSLLQPRRLALAAGVASVAVAVFSASWLQPLPRPVHLHPQDEAFVSEVMADYQQATLDVQRTGAGQQQPGAGSNHGAVDE